MVPRPVDPVTTAVVNRDRQRSIAQMTKRAISLAFLAFSAFVTSAGCDTQATSVAPPTRPFIVVANQRSGVATMVELSTGRVSHVELGARPHEVAVSPDGSVAVLTIPSETFGASRKVMVLDIATAKVARTITLDDYRQPHGIAFISDSIALIGTLGGTSAVYVNVRSGQIERAVEGLPANPYVIRIAGNGRAYVSSPHSSMVSEIDVASGQLLRTISIPDDPAGIAITADGKELFAAVWRDKIGGGIAIYDVDKGSVVSKLPATQPRRLAVTTDGRFIVASDRDHLRIIERSTREVRSVDTGANGGGSGVDCSPDSTRCYVALIEAGEIVEVDIIAGIVTRRFIAQRGVDGLAYVR